MIKKFVQKNSLKTKMAKAGASCILKLFSLNGGKIETIKIVCILHEEIRQFSQSGKNMQLHMKIDIYLIKLLGSVTHMK